MENEPTWTYTKYHSEDESVQTMLPEATRLACPPSSAEIRSGYIVAGLAGNISPGDVQLHSEVLARRGGVQFKHTWQQPFYSTVVIRNYLRQNITN